MNLTIDRVRAAVDEASDQIAGFLQELVRIPSLPGHEQRAQEFLAQAMREMGLGVTVVKSERERLQAHPAFCDDGVPFVERLNVVGRWRGTGNGRSLILNGHMDVVTPGDEFLWSHEPWSGNIVDGKLYGRGACDMKAGLTASLFAVRVLRELNFRPGNDVLLQSVIGEETGGVGTLALIDNGFTADAAIIAEPTALTLCPIQAGALTFRLKVNGRAAHASMRKTGVSAIEKFYLLERALAELERERHLTFESPWFEDPAQVAPISVGTIQGGEWHSTVPASVVAEGRFGVLPGESVNAARAACLEALARASAQDDWMRANPPVIEWIEGQFESGATQVEHPLVSMLTETHRKILRRDAVVRGVTYGSDLRLFTNHAGMPAVLYGPGNVEQAHAVDEFVRLEEVFECAKVLAWMIVEWCGGEFAS